MTLIVCAWSDQPDGTRLDLKAEPPHNDLAGVEAARHSFYASPRSLELGLTLLPTLAQGDIYARGAELDRLEQEVTVLLNDLAPSDRYWTFRLSNILEAIRRARAAPSGVGVVYVG